jgi:hypothetical protein
VVSVVAVEGMKIAVVIDAFVVLVVESIAVDFGLLRVGWIDGYSGGEVGVVHFV